MDLSQRFRVLYDQCLQFMLLEKLYMEGNVDVAQSLLRSIKEQSG